MPVIPRKDGGHREAGCQKMRENLCFSDCVPLVKSTDKDQWKVENSPFGSTTRCVGGGGGVGGGVVEAGPEIE